MWLQDILYLSRRDFVVNLKGSVRERLKGYRLNAIKKRFLSLLMILLSVASIRRKLLKT